MRRDEIIRLLAEHKAELRRFGVKSLALFGSVARDIEPFDRLDTKASYFIINGMHRSVLQSRWRSASHMLADRQWKPDGGGWRRTGQLMGTGPAMKVMEIALGISIEQHNSPLSPIDRSVRRVYNSFCMVQRFSCGEPP